MNYVTSKGDTQISSFPNYFTIIYGLEVLTSITWLWWKCYLRVLLTDSPFSSMTAGGNLRLAVGGVFTQK